VAGDDSFISAEVVVQAFSLVLGVIIFATVAFREGWEAVLFLLMFLAIWQFATFEPAGHL
jgi:hypothetical protein